MRAPNYRQARKEKERSRKLRQTEKQQRRAARVKPGEEASPDVTPTEGTSQSAPAPAPGK